MKIVKLGEILSFRNGRSFMKTDWRTKGVPIIRIQNLNNKAAPFNYFDGEYDKNIEIHQGDLLFSWSGTVGTSFGPHIWEGKTGVLNQHIFKLAKKADTEDRYIYYAMKEITSEIEKQTHGAGGLVHITKEKLERFTIAIPEPEEQRRVVERLDTAFEKIDRAIELTEKNIKNTDALFGSLLDKIVRQNPDVEDRSISEIADIEYGLTEKSKAKGDYRLIRITDINNEGFLTNENKAYVSASQKSEKYLLHNGDIVVARTGATFGKVLFFDDEENAVFASYLIRINFNEKILPKLFWYFAKTPQYWDQANALAGGAAQPQFNGNALKRVKFSYPASRNEQQAIIEILDTHHQSTLKLKTIYQKKLDGLNALKQALLTQAFSQDGVK